jgi:hypothetical protein
MALHGLWDMSIFVQTQSDGPVNLLTVLIWPTSILAAIAGFVVARRTAQGPVEDYARGPQETTPAAT